MKHTCFIALLGATPPLKKSGDLNARMKQSFGTLNQNTDLQYLRHTTNDLASLSLANERSRTTIKSP
jgi:hypothetical protein